MIEIGKHNNLVVLKKTPIGLFLGDLTEEILLPVRYAPEAIEIGDKLEVFVYLDNESRPIATTLKPIATVDQYAFLAAKEINQHGAFMDWGIDKDLFVPYSEQTEEMQAGNKYLVFIFIDERSGRIAGSMKWNEFIDDEKSNFRNGEAVELIIAQQTELGYKAIINNRFEGLIYLNEVFEPLQTGDIKQGYIKQMREDGKIDLSLQQQGYMHIENTKHPLLQLLKDNKGVLALGDKSSPEEIYRQLKMSKKVFKKTIGGLFKEQKITIGDFEIRLTAHEE